MPLGCDCYPGCWADHSKEWPEVPYSPERGMFLIGEDDIPYGCYVIMRPHYQEDRGASGMQSYVSKLKPWLTPYEM